MATDTYTGDVRSVEVTSARQGPSRQFASQSPAGQLMAMMTRDDATQRSSTETSMRIRPIRRNWRAWKEECPAAAARNDTLRTTRHLGRALWKRWAGYHDQSRVEARLSRLRAFGTPIMSPDPDRQTAEIQFRIAKMNHLYSLVPLDIEAVA